jgi:MFS family permease
MQINSRQPGRAAAAAFLGTMIEWYDFFSYGTASALVFGDVFFAAHDAFVATMASLATFAVGFVARPVGALIFGHLGDRIGRKQSLVITLVLMGGATTLIGLIPSYASIGASAAVVLLVLRLVQGLAVGGEWGGAVLIATEHAHPKWRTFLASAPQYGSPIGLLLSTLMFRAVSSLPSAAFHSWGWRVPFLASAVLMVVAFAVRRSVNESPELERRRQAGQLQGTAPLWLLLRTHKKALLFGIALCMLGLSGFYFVTTLMITYTTTWLKVPRAAILDVMSWVGVVMLLSFPVASFIAHRIGERRFLIGITAVSLLWAVPAMRLISTGDLGSIALAMLVAIFFIGAYFAVVAAYLPRAFPVEFRYTGISLSYQLCGAMFGGTTPLVGMWIANTYGAHWEPLAILFAAISAVTLIGAIFLPTDERHAGRRSTMTSTA